MGMNFFLWLWELTGWFFSSSHLGSLMKGELGTRHSGNSQAASLPLQGVFQQAFFMTQWPWRRGPNAQRQKLQGLLKSRL